MSLDNFELPEASVSVTLHNSSFTDNGEKYIKVTRNTVTLENLIAAIIDENRGIDSYMVQHSAFLLQQQILKMLQKGNCVNVLNLGNLYIAMSGTVKGDNPSASDLPDFKVKFTPSAAVNEAISTLVVDKIVKADTSPAINIITDEWTKEQNSVLTKGKTCLIEGTHLKIGGNEHSISFIMIDDEGNEIKDQETIQVTDEMIITNTIQNLQFYIPESLTSGSRYKIRLTTSYLRKDLSRKSALSTDSCILTVN